MSNNIFTDPDTDMLLDALTVVLGLTLMFMDNNFRLETVALLLLGILSFWYHTVQRGES